MCCDIDCSKVLSSRENAHNMLEMAGKCSNYARNWGLCFSFWIMLFEADYAKNYASILYQCLAASRSCRAVGQQAPLCRFFSFFFFFLSFRECCLTRQWQSTECDTRYMVQRKKFDVILRFLVDRYRRTKPPKPDASQFVVPARLPKPVIDSGGLSSSRFDDDVPEINCTWTASFSWRVKEAALWFESYGSKNLTGGTTWSSQSTSTDWLMRTHHWSSPRSKLAYNKPTSTRKLRKFPVTSGQGSKHRDWTASRWWARWRSQSSSCQHHVITWRGLIPADHEYLDSVAWPCHDCEVAPVWHHDITNARTCHFFRRLFDRLPVRISTSDLHHRILRKKLYHIRAYEFGVQFSFKGSVERSRHERHFCSLLLYFLLSWLQIFQRCWSFWTSSFDLVLFKKFLHEKEK